MPRSARRCLLFVPGDDEHKIRKASRLDVDAVVLDLEDAVAPARKAHAREVVRRAFDTIDFGARERMLRINPAGTGLSTEDVEAVVPAHPDAIVLPKAESAADVRDVSRAVGAIEQSAGWPSGEIRLLALIESAAGVLRAGEIAGADPRLDALIFGAEDYAGDVGAVRTRSGQEIAYARSAVVVAAAAFRLDAIDTPFVELHDDEGLREETLSARRLGYCGKLAIHPRQISIIQSVFTPAPEEVERARDLIEAWEEHERAGRGVFAWRGRMIDMPMIRAARRILERAEPSRTPRRSPR